MQRNDVTAILQTQRDYYKEGHTLPLSARIHALKILQSYIQEHEREFLDALHADLGKSDFEGYTCEVGLALSELRFVLKRLKKWAKPRRVKTPLAQFASKSYRQPTPYGNVLIVSPWNYPFLLTVEPLISALAAGNTAILKPSAYSPATGAAIQKMTDECFAPQYVATVLGGRAENACLLAQKFDFIFFTGSQNVGKEVMRAAAENLTPIALELGGKSPCIVDETAKIPLAAKRIVFGKFLNCGQTCVAPDYILCAASIKDDLVACIKEEVTAQFGEKPLENPAYGKIVNAKHFARLKGLIQPEKTAYGGGVNEEKLKIEPTLLNNVTWDDGVMQEEIFGPILPILTFENFDEVDKILEDKQKPLALYLFTQDKKRAKAAMARWRFGGGCINDVIIHLATSEMGFGGVGESGMGEYHGKAGFDLFSHEKSIVDKKTWIDLPMRYQPYTKKKEKIVRKFLK